jgi:hypothetical protein
MPFKSTKQRKYLWANEPEVAKTWTEKYGSKVRPSVSASLKKTEKRKKPKRMSK